MRDIDVEIPIEHLDEVDSTSLLARRLVEEGEIGDQARLLIAARQTGGVGRFGRRWESPAGGLWMTLIWPVNLDIRRVVDGLGLRIGLACVHAIEHVLATHGHGEDVRLKWPNDVLIGGRKVLGTLCEVIEHDGKPFALVGVGINANFPITDLPEELRHDATTLQTVTDGPVVLDRLVDDLRERLRAALMSEGVSTPELEDLRHHLFGVGSQVQVKLGDGSEQRGRLLGLDEQGRLQLDTAEGEFTAPSGAELIAS